MDSVDNSFEFSTEENVCANDVPETDAEAVEVGTNDLSINNSVVVLLKTFMVVSVVDIDCNEDDNACSVELEIVLVPVVLISVTNVVLVSDND
jgi:hypothetical protein